MHTNIITIQYLLMKYLLTALFVFISYQSLSAQSITVTTVPDQDGHNLYTFPVQNGSLIYSNQQFIFADAQIVQPEAWSLSPGKNKLAFLQKEGTLFLRSFDYAGRILIEQSLEFFDPDDSTLDVYQLSDGRVIVRDNVANFSFFDSRGEQIFSVSNFAQSPDGERESRFSSDKYGRTIVLYNPVIAYSSSMGSRAQLMFGENQTESFFRDDSREIKSLVVSDDGAFITLIASDGNNDRVLIFDRFGNELFSLDADGVLTGAVVSDCGEFVTTFSEARMQVIRVADGESIGSASARNQIIKATFFPQDEILVSINGILNNNRISNGSVTAVHLSRRQIASENINIQLSMLHTDRLNLNWYSSNQFRTGGLNRDLIIEARF